MISKLKLHCVFRLAPLVSTIKAHADVISSISFCHLDDTVLVIAGSSDCSVSLHNIFGTKIGVFGQPDLWKIKPLNLVNELINEGNDGLKGEEIVMEDKKTVYERQPSIIDYKNISNEFDIPEYTGSLEFGLVKKLNADLKVEDTYTYDKEAFVKNPALRYDPWSKTILGKNKSLIKFLYS